MSARLLHEFAVLIFCVHGSSTSEIWKQERVKVDSRCRLHLKGLRCLLPGPRLSLVVNAKQVTVCGQVTKEA